MRNSLFYILFISLFAISDDGCEVSKWGKDDEIGAANLISNWIKKYKWIAWLGLLAILIVAVELIYTDIKTLIL